MKISLIKYKLNMQEITYWDLFENGVILSEAGLHKILRGKDVRILR